MRSRKHSLHRPSNSLPPVSFRLERWHRLAVYAALTWLTITGIMWLVAHYFLRMPGEFGETVHPLEPLSMKLHGAGAMLGLFFIGSMLNNHIRRAIKARRNLISGWSMIALLTILVISGYGLYYLAGEASRPVWSIFHWIIGLSLPLILVLHIALGRKASRSAIN